jgi:hypothetical protein
MDVRSLAAVQAAPLAFFCVVLKMKGPGFRQGLPYLNHITGLTGELRQP